MDHSWEDFFREKSGRRANAAAIQPVLGWSGAGVGLLLLVVALLRAIDL